MFKSLKPVQQVAALPFALRDGSFEVLLVTSRRKRESHEDGSRWILPKGWPKGRETLADSAMREAQEEAGVTGAIHPMPVGEYRYSKAMRAGYSVDAHVFVFALHVHEVRDKWRERKKRDRRWLTLDEAAETVGDGDAARLLTRLSARGGETLHTILAEMETGCGDTPAPGPAV
ncbi:MAG: NUDIX hydrolase [Alphaproteobacteria bacterium]